MTLLLHSKEVSLAIDDGIAEIEGGGGQGSGFGRSCRRVGREEGADGGGGAADRAKLQRLEFALVTRLRRRDERICRGGSGGKVDLVGKLPLEHMDLAMLLLEHEQYPTLSKKRDIYDFLC
ncbi:hypothetical protein OsI_18396 [Oryza sativa Indica Group]|uniref:Uncharacterized protein n=1 Tax=Oryza sativa subsp. indica TaxID=39946 RepID=B8AXW0_ORYSI|nr:hypothetical protein OsI_18396 [Oryza sativa Indica Group]